MRTTKALYLVGALTALALLCGAALAGPVAGRTLVLDVAQQDSVWSNISTRGEAYYLKVELRNRGVAYTNNDLRGYLWYASNSLSAAGVKINQSTQESGSVYFYLSATNTLGLSTNAESYFAQVILTNLAGTATYDWKQGRFATRHGSGLTGAGVAPSTSIINWDTITSTGTTPWSSGGGAVASVFGRTGVVVAASGDYTAAQVGAMSGAAVTQAIASATGGLAVVAHTGAYGDLSGVPSIPSTNGLATEARVVAATQGLAAVAHSGAYGDLSGAPSIPSTAGLINAEQATNIAAAVNAAEGSVTNVSGGILTIATRAIGLTFASITNALAGTYAAVVHGHAGTEITGPVASATTAATATNALDFIAWTNGSRVALGTGATAGGTGSGICIGSNAKYTGIGGGISIGTGATTDLDSVSIGISSKSYKMGTAIGPYAANEAAGSSATQYGIAIGSSATTQGTNCTAIGRRASASGNDAIQIGRGTNTTDNTLQVGTWPLLTFADGLIPAARLPAIPYATSAGTAATATNADYATSAGTVTGSQSNEIAVAATNVSGGILTIAARTIGLTYAAITNALAGTYAAVVHGHDWVGNATNANYAASAGTAATATTLVDNATITIAPPVASNSPVSKEYVDGMLVGNFVSFWTTNLVTTGTNGIDGLVFASLPTVPASSTATSIQATAVGQYLATWIATNRTVTQLQGGAAEVEIWMHENTTPGSLTIKPELYLYDTVRGALVEFGENVASQTVAAGAVATKHIFSVPYGAMATNNPCMLAIRPKVTSIANTPTVLIYAGGTTPSHFSVDVPTSSLVPDNAANAYKLGGVAASGYVTNGGATINGSPITNGAAITVAGGNWWTNRPTTQLNITTNVILGSLSLLGTRDGTNLEYVATSTNPPSAVGFYAVMGGDQTNVAPNIYATVAFASASWDSQNGFSTSTYSYVVQTNYAGSWTFGASVFFDDIDQTEWVWCGLRHISGTTTNEYYSSYSTASVADAAVRAQMTHMLPNLIPGDKVSVIMQHTAADGAGTLKQFGTTTWFWGTRNGP